MNENENLDLLGDLNDLIDEKELDEVEENEDEKIYIPLSYQIFTTSNNQPNGTRDIVDSYVCDRKNGIVPNLKAKKKADLMKVAFPKKTFFVEAEYNVIIKGESKKVKEICYQTK